MTETVQAPPRTRPPPTPSSPAAAGAVSAWSSIPPDRRRAMVSAVVAQCFGMLTQQMLSAGLLLLYLNALQAPPGQILAFLSLAPLLTAVLSLPLGWCADHVGIKRMGTLGNWTMVTGLALVAGAGSVSDPFRRTAVLALGLVLHTVGATLFNNGWFSLLSHIVPRAVTGRYFGILRFTWQVVAIAFFSISSLFFSAHTPVPVYQLLMGLGAAAIAARSLFYRDIPSPPPPSEPLPPFLPALRRILGIPGLVRYLVYLLLLSITTSNGSDILRLDGARGIRFGDDFLMRLSVAGMVGSLVGFATAGRFIDKWGPRRVFLVCHFGFAIALALFPARDHLPLPAETTALAAAALLGASAATLGLATTAESFLLCSVAGGRTLAYSVVTATSTFGSGASGFALSALVGRMVGGRWANPFDLVLAGLAGWILLQILSIRMLGRPPRDARG